MGAIFSEQQKSFRMTLQSPDSKGKLKWTEFQFWPALDLAENKRAMLVSTLNVTQQRVLEQQLESAKDQLQRYEAQPCLSVPQKFEQSAC